MKKKKRIEIFTKEEIWRSPESTLENGLYKVEEEEESNPETEHIDSSAEAEVKFRK